ncbi:MAG: AraC family transcriptional regulator [Bacteroidota bacterium]
MAEYQYILLIALGQGLLLAFFLLTSKYYKTTANQWLAIALILLSSMSIIDVASSNYAPDSLWLEFFLHDIELGFLVYVPLYVFFKFSTSNPTNKQVTFNYYLLLPFIVDTIINIFIVLTYPIETIGSTTQIQIFYEVETVLSILFNVFLCYKSYHLIKFYHNNSGRKDWIYKIWQSTVVLLLVWLLITIAGYVISSLFATLIYTLYIIVSIWMFWMIYNGIVNLKLIDDREEISQKLTTKPLRSSTSKSVTSIESPKESVVPIESQNSSIKNSSPESNPYLFDSHFKKINSLMVSETLYRNEDLSIDDVAQQMDMSAGYISKIIKKITKKNFPIWVNEFRVAEVKAMFGNEDFHHYTTLSIGLEAGFKSKSAFYATFKKMTGETPAKFRKKKS